jgi:hypothetical protein
MNSVGFANESIQNFTIEYGISAAVHVWSIVFKIDISARKHDPEGVTFEAS